MKRKLFLGQKRNQREVGEVTSDGTVYRGTGVHKEIYGRVSEDGRVYRGVGRGAECVGRVDNDGNIYEGKGLFERKIGHVDDNGNVHNKPSGLLSLGEWQTPIGQVQDVPSPNPRSLSGLGTEPFGNMDRRVLRKLGQNREPKPSRVKPEGAALLLLFMDK